jgi:hypothetical protein
MHGPTKDLTGQRYGRLEVLDYAGPDANGNVFWTCRCDCGPGVITVRGDRLRSGKTSSCGCLARERVSEARKTHGHSGDPLYPTWSAMHQRCANPNSPAYRYYGALGVTVDRRWNDFETFLADMGDRPPDPPGWSGGTSYYSINRIDTTGNYAPENCRWTDWVTQNNNQRRHHPPTTIPRPEGTSCDY